MNKLLLFMLCIPLMGYTIFEHDRAVSAAQKGDYKQARTLMQLSITNAPDNPSVLYDAGVAAYKTGDLEQAHAYFNAVTSADNASQELQELIERAHFNLGNVCAVQQKYKEAIESYDRALAIDEHDEHAVHNRDVVKKLLEQQQQQQKQQQQKQDEENQEEHNDQEQQDQQQDNDQSNDQSDEQRDKKSQERKHNDKREGTREQQRDTSKEQEEKKQQQDAAQQQSKKQEREEQRAAQDHKKKHDDAPHKEPQRQPAPSSVAQDEQQKQSLDPMLARELAAQEQEDAQLNKQMIKANIDKQLAGCHGQNCW